MHNGSEAPRLSPSPEATVQRRPSLPMQAAMDLRRIFLFELPTAPEAYLKQKKKELSTKGH